MIGPLGALYGVVKQGVRMVQGYRLVPMAWVVATAAFAGEYVKPPLPPEATFPSGKVVKVTETGAVADGTTLASEAIAKAIEQCAAAGGGIVEFPERLQKQTDQNPNPAPTVYLTGPITLKSNNY
jgi:polygalacturonase